MRYYNQNGEQTCEEMTAVMRFASSEDKNEWIANCEASRIEDTSDNSSVDDPVSAVETPFLETKQGKFLFFAVIGAGIYYMYKKGVFK